MGILGKPNRFLLPSSPSITARLLPPPLLQPSLPRGHHCKFSCRNLQVCVLFDLSFSPFFFMFSFSISSSSFSHLFFLFLFFLTCQTYTTSFLFFFFNSFLKEKIKKLLLYIFDTLLLFILNKKCCFILYKCTFYFFFFVLYSVFPYPSVWPYFFSYAILPCLSFSSAALFFRFTSFIYVVFILITSGFIGLYYLLY